MCVKCSGLCKEARLEVSFFFFLQAFLLFFGKLYYSPAYKSVYTNWKVCNSRGLLHSICSKAKASNTTVNSLLTKC